MKDFIIVLCCIVGAWIVLDFLFSRLTLTVYHLQSDKIKNSVKAVFISDFHNGKNAKRLLKMVANQAPDVVFLGGDVVDRHTGRRKALKLVEALAKDYKVYFAPGNHEYFNIDTEAFFKELEELGVVVLEDDHRLVEINGNRLDICGIYVPHKMSEKDASKQLRRIDSVSDKSAYRVLLAHFPKFARSYSRRRFDLVLCGHEHGGVIRMPLSGRGIFGHSGIHPMYSGGHYKLRFTSMIVSRGVGYLHYNYVIPRLFNNPELVTVIISKR